MKKNYIYLILALSLAASCAKNQETQLNESAARYFEAWVQSQQAGHPDLAWKKGDLGYYTLLSTSNPSGELAGDQEGAPYVLVDYNVCYLSNYLTESDSPGMYLYGNVQSTTSEKICRQLGTYSASDFYGPQVWKRSDNALLAGVDDVISGMREGERRWVVIPGWLQTYSRYDNEEGYLKNVSGTNMAYDITLRKIIKDVDEYQLDSIKTYLSENYPAKAFDDTLETGWGCYYIQKKAPRDAKEFPSDTTFYINYTGRLLNGQVFDTTDENTAKEWNIYSPTRSYKPILVNWGEKWSDITITSDKSAVVKGFAKGLWQMRHAEKGTVIFYSALGYGASGSGGSIPSFSPLIFELDIIDKKPAEQ